MSTPRRRYRIDVCRDSDGELHTLLRRVPGDIYGWCAHYVRARSVASAHHKAARAHEAHEAKEQS
jgi:hypothetical protein